MQTLASKVLELKNSVIQRAPIPKSDEELFWDTVKHNIDQLTTQFEKEVEKVLHTDKDRIYTSKIGPHHKDQKICGQLSHTKTEMDPIQGKTVELIVYECDRCGVVSAWYSVFNNVLNQCYVRQLADI
jgi:hypothetical protein